MSNDTARNTHKMRLTIIVLATIALAGVGFGGFMAFKYRGTQNNEQAEQKKLVAQLSETIELPNSTPTVVTIVDKNKLSNKILASRVENKDILLIYSNTKRIVVYRPSTKKVVDMLSFAAQTELPTSQDGGNNPATPQTKTKS